MAYQQFVRISTMLVRDVFVRSCIVRTHKRERIACARAMFAMCSCVFVHCHCNVIAVFVQCSHGLDYHWRLGLPRANGPTFLSPRDLLHDE